MNTPSYAYGVHTSESQKDDVDQDTGAENLASFLTTRRDAAGYYFDVFDSDSWVAMVPSSYTVFQIATSGFNSRTLGGSFACRQSELFPDDWWTQAAMLQMGAGIRWRWQELGVDLEYASVWLPADEALVRPCLFNHGDAQPKDRSDAFLFRGDRDRQEALQQMLVNAILEGDDSLSAEDVIAINAHTSAVAAAQTAQLWSQKIWHDARDGSLWLVYRQTRIYLRSAEDVTAAINNGAIVPANASKSPSEFYLKHVLGAGPGEQTLSWKLDELMENVGALLAINGVDGSKLPPAGDD